MYRNEREAMLYGFSVKRINHVPKRTSAWHGVKVCLGYALGFGMAAAIGVMLAF